MTVQVPVQRTFGTKHVYSCRVTGCRLSLRISGVDSDVAARVWAHAEEVHMCVPPTENWPPQIGDVWADRDGTLWAVRDDMGQTAFVSLSAGVDLSITVAGFAEHYLPAALQWRPSADMGGVEAAQDVSQ